MTYLIDSKLQRREVRLSSTGLTKYRGEEGRRTNGKVAWRGQWTLRGQFRVVEG